MNTARTAGILTLVAFFLGIIILYFDYASNAGLQGIATIESSLLYVEFKASDLNYRIADILGIVYGLILVYTVVILFWLYRNETAQVMVGFVFFIFSIFFYLVQRTLHLLPAYYLKDLTLEFNILTGPIYSDLSLIASAVTSFNTLFLLLTALSFLMIGNHLLKAPGREYRLGLFMVFTSVFALLTAFIFLMNAIPSVSELSTIALIGLAGYSIFNFLYLLCIFLISLLLFASKDFFIKEENSN